jgi:hypothetical protein
VEAGWNIDDGDESEHLVREVFYRRCKVDIRYLVVMKCILFEVTRSVMALISKR